MEETKTSRFILRKIWYAVVILLCGIIILASLASGAATWITQNALSNTTVAVLQAIENTAGGLQLGIDRIDQPLAEVQTISTEIISKTEEISQNVSDSGVILTLLPSEQESKLLELGDSITTNFKAIKEVLSSTISLFRSINSLPFVNLPSPEQEKIDSIEESINQTQLSIENMRAEIQLFRDQASSSIDRVAERVEQFSNRISETRERLDQVNSELVEVQETTKSLQKTIPGLLVLGAILATIILAFVIYTQVEVIILCIQRWKQLSN